MSDFLDERLEAMTGHMDSRNNPEQVRFSDHSEVSEEQLRAKASDSSLVNRPPHYTQYKGLEVIDLVEQMPFNRGNAVKYICRAGFKDPNKEVEDLQKARWYIEREISRLESLGS